MSKYGLIAGINWAIAAMAVVGSVIVISQIFAPIPPATWSVGAPGYEAKQLQSANEILPLNGQRKETSNSTIQSSVMDQQSSFQTAQPPARNNAADPRLATAGSQNNTNQNAASPSTSRPQPSERVVVGPAGPPTPSQGWENLPPHMRNF